MATTNLTVELPKHSEVIELAPRVDENEYGKSGFALRIDHAGNILVVWDDGVSEWVEADEITFRLNGSNST